MVSSNLAPPPEAAAPLGERRASVRKLCDWEGYCERMGGRSDQLWWFARVRDLSAHGIGLFLKHCFEPGTLLLIELASPDRQRSHRFRAQVVRAKPEADGWLMGCAFLNILSPEEQTAAVS